MILKLYNGLMLFVAQKCTIFTNPFHFTSFTIVKICRFWSIPIECVTVNIDFNRYSLNSNTFSCKLADSLVGVSFLAINEKLIGHLALNSNVHLWANRLHVW